MIAASMGFAEVVSLLLSLDSTDRNCTDEHQETALYKSVIKSFGKVFKVLVEDDRCRNGAKTFNNGAGNIVDACCLSACPEIWDWLKVNGERVWEPPEDATYSFEVGRGLWTMESLFILSLFKINVNLNVFPRRCQHEHSRTVLSCVLRWSQCQQESN